MANIIARADVANTPSIITSAGDVLATNKNRRAWGIQNVGTNPLRVLMGTGASSTVFHFILKGGTADNDGFGGSIMFNSGVIFTGPISIDGTTPKAVVFEL